MSSGGTGSICHAVLAYRDHAAATRGIDRPNVIKPETAHPAFDKACHLFGVELRVAPVDPDTTQVDTEWVADAVDDQTVALIGSACNYGYGTVDPIEALSDIALDRGIGLHVDGCLGGWILPFGQELGYDIPLFDFRVPGVTSISADTHKYGYALKGTSVLSFRDKALRNAQYFFNTGWSGGKYCSPGMDGLALGRPAGRHLGLDGPARPGGLPAATPSRSSPPRRPCRPRCAATTSCGSSAARPSCSASPRTGSTSTTSTTSCGCGAGASTASSTRTPSTWPSPGPRPARRGRGLRRRPGRGRGLRHRATPTRPRSRGPSTAAWPGG